MHFQLPGYHLGREIGRGGNGRVYLARQDALDRNVAIKLIPHLRRGQRFLAEAQALARLHHPNVVQVFDAGIEGKIGWLVMERVPGGSMATYPITEDPRLPPLDSPRRAQEIARILYQIASALAAAHSKGLVHGDVKPGNILLDEQGRAVLVDFGLAAPTSQAVSGSAVVGTPGYLAPEQIRSGTRSPCSDVYALGSVGRTLLEGVACTDETRDLYAIIDCCTQPEPGDRYCDGAELTKDLRRFLDLRPVHAAPRRGWNRLRLWLRRHPLRASTLVLGAGLTAALLWTMQRGNSLSQDAKSLQQENLSLAIADMFAQDQWQDFDPLIERHRDDLGQVVEFTRLAADALVRAGRWDEAISVYHMLSADDRDSTTSFALAYASHPQTVPTAPSCPFPSLRDCLVRAIVFSRGKMHSPALAWAERGLERSPQHLLLRDIRLRSLFALGNRGAAIRALEETMALRQDNAEYDLLLIRWLTWSSRFNEAERRLQIALQTFGATDDLLTSRLRLHLESGNWTMRADAARQLLAHANTQPLSTRALLVLARHQALQGDMAKAEKQLQLASLRIDSDPEMIAFLRGEIVQLESDWPQAEEQYLIAAASTKENIAREARIGQIECLAGRGETQDALQQLEAYGAGNSHFQLAARLALHLDDPEHALQFIDLGLSRDPLNPRLRRMRSEALLVAGAAQLAYDEAHVAQVANPDSPLLDLWLAFVSSRADRIDRARELIDRVGEPPVYELASRLLWVATLIGLGDLAAADEALQITRDQVGEARIQRALWDFPGLGATLAQRVSTDSKGVK